jgi:hypothetical protein
MPRPSRHPALSMCSLPARLPARLPAAWRTESNLPGCSRLGCYQCGAGCRGRGCRKPHSI